MFIFVYLLCFIVNSLHYELYGCYLSYCLKAMQRLFLPFFIQLFFNYCCYLVCCFSIDVLVFTYSLVSTTGNFSRD